MKEDNLGVKNILVVRNDRFGEFLLNIPAMRALRETFKDAKVIAMVSPRVRELAEAVPFIDEIIVWEKEKHSLAGKLSLIRQLKSKKIDMAIMLNPSKELNVLTFLAGIPVRVGYRKKLGFLLTRKIKDEKFLGRMHEVDYNLRLVGLVGAATQDKSLSLDIIEDFNDGLTGKGEDNLLALHPWTSDSLKQWPVENFHNLAERLANEPKIKVIVIGGQEEQSKGPGFFPDSEKGIIDLTGKTSLRELATLLKKCRLLISGDSGPVHLACAVGTPVIALFRNDIPGKSAKRWGPWGRGCAVIEKEKLAAISVDEVLQKAKEMLKI